MARGRTLWEMLVDWVKEKVHGPTELQFYNPLKARVGNAVQIDEVELKDYQFFIREIRAYRRTLQGKAFFFADYIILARPLGQEDVRYRLRLHPEDDPERGGGIGHHVLLLQCTDDLPYTAELHQAVTDSSGEFQIHEDGRLKEQFWRINDLKTPYRARVSVLQDLDQNRKVTREEVQHVELEYWDYWRETDGPAGLPVREFLFVEMDKGNGWFQIWRGREVDPRRVLVL